MSKNFKEAVIRLFEKKEKTVQWNWILRIGVILFVIAVAFTILAIAFTMLGNVEDLTLFGMEMNDLSSYSGMIACVIAVVGIFFIFCGKTKKP